MPRFNSPGVYTSEKDLGLRSGNGGGFVEVVNNNAVNTYSPDVKKPIFWILQCGWWDDEGTWLDYAYWEDSILC